MTETAIVDARGLHSFYGASHILHGVDFSVSAGEAVGLMGRNGMGKTTLIRTLIGHVVPRHGEVKINGLLMTGADRAGRTWPVFLEGFGAGDNRTALYAALAIPAVAALGPGTAATRAPAALVGALTVLAVFPIP